MQEELSRLADQSIWYLFLFGVWEFVPLYIYKISFSRLTAFSDFTKICQAHILLYYSAQ